MAKKKYPIITKICPVCQSTFDTQVGHRHEKTTCSRSCSNTFFAKVRHTEEANKKTSITLQNYLEENIRGITIYQKICPACNVSFESKRKNQIYCCSNQCSKKKKPKYPFITKICPACNNSFQTKVGSSGEKTTCSHQCSSTFFVEKYKNCSKNMLKLWANDEYRRVMEPKIRWKSRSKLNPSYPEKYTIVLLDMLHINYEREFYVGKWFIDFADPIRKLALEIDGRQHDLPKQKASDQNKDRFLIESGWKVLRIRWKRPSQKFRDYMIATLKTFFS